MKIGSPRRDLRVRRQDMRDLASPERTGFVREIVTGGELLHQHHRALRYSAASTRVSAS